MPGRRVRGGDGLRLTDRIGRGAAPLEETRALIAAAGGAPLADLPVADRQALLDINITGVLHGVRINAVSPGASATTLSPRPGETEADRTARMKEESPPAGCP